MYVLFRPFFSLLEARLTKLAEQPSSGSTCGNFLGSGPQYTYAELVQNNWFKSQTGFRRLRDSSSQTVVLYNPTTSVFIPFVLGHFDSTRLDQADEIFYVHSTEDPLTIFNKARYAFRRRLAGLTVFDTSGDYNGQLVNQIRNGLSIVRGQSAPVASKRKRHLDHKKLQAALKL